MLINRAPVLTLWATIVARRMGYSEDEALTLGKAVAGYTAQFKGRALGTYKAREKGETDRGGVQEREVQIVEFMGRQIPALEEGGQVWAVTKDKPVDPDSVRRYFTTKFGEDLEEVSSAMEDLEEVSSAMEDLAGSYDPEELNNVAFRLYEKFRPEIPKGSKGWGAKGELSPKKIRELKGRTYRISS
jgi:hypothetical protein